MHALHRLSIVDTSPRGVGLQLQSVHGEVSLSDSAFNPLVVCNCCSSVRDQSN